MAKKLWGGRFTKITNPLVEDFTKSIHFDKKLAIYDCAGSLYYIDVLKKAGILKADEHKKLYLGLNEILTDIKYDRFEVDETFEDIHTYVQYLLEKNAGAVALKLHTARSRNDQVLFDVKLYCLENLAQVNKLIVKTGKAFVNLALANKDVQMPAYTHLQQAMPVNLSDHILTYSEMLKRDFERIDHCYKNIVLTMGSGAVAGSYIDSSKYEGVVELFFEEKEFNVKSPVNPIDTISDRDFVIEILSALSIIGMHLSRLSEDFVIWATKEFDYIDIDESFCTGSSLMPHKKNPDVLELMRGYTGKLYGNLISVLVMMKGLPLSYNRDMQHDKEPLFSSFEIIQSELKLLPELLGNIKFKKENIKKSLQNESLYATDIVDYLVKKEIPFKDAHDIVGKLIKFSADKSVHIKDLSDAKLKEFSKKFVKKEIIKLFNPKTSVESKKSIKRRT